MPDTPCKDQNENWLACLRASGYRLTSSRKAIVDTLAGSQRALTPTEIFDLARALYPSLGLVSVYRTLAKLEALDLIQRVHQPEGCQAYIAAFTGHQHLLICQICGKAKFFAGGDLDALVARVEQESGYRVDEHWLQFFGVCAECQ